MASLGGIVFVILFLLFLPLTIGDKLREDTSTVLVVLVFLLIAVGVVWELTR